MTINKLLNFRFAGLAAGLSMLLAACSTTPPPGPGPGSGPSEVDQRVREPAREESAGVQVFPLENPAVTELMADASSAEQQGRHEQAAMLLERALRIQPRNPELLQNMAEVQLQLRDYDQAMGFATRSYDLGPRVGELCSRNWRTIGVAREYMNDTRGAAEAEQHARACKITKPEGL